MMHSADISNEADEINTIAVVGMSGRFPGAATLEQFWRNLSGGVESILPLSDDDLAQAGVARAQSEDARYVKAAAMLDGIELFDAGFFGYTPREAELIDPQQRLFLECAWEALEHAGYDPAAYAGAIGVYGGAAMSAYLIENLCSNPQVLATTDARQLMLGNEKDFLCTRVAYKLDLKGPAVVVQSACSTSLVAVHQACQAILNGECDMALAGGAAISGLVKRGYLHAEGGIFSADGHCRAFDAQASGTVSGNGVGIVVLKSLAAARADGDTVHALIRGSAINNDGAAKVSFAAPSVDGQAAVIREAHGVAGVAPDTISYIEAHGTGTVLGDPVEVRALQQAFAGAGATGYCAIGSVKTNLGHLDAAAGVAGLIKTVLALSHKAIPPSLHYTRANAHIDFEQSPFFVNTTLTPWQQAGWPRRAGISAFGIGGTNAHAVLEEAPARPHSGPARRAQLLMVSARSPAAVEQGTANLAAFLAADPAVNLADVAHTLQRGRRHFAYRRSVCATSVAAAAASLAAPGPIQASDAGPARLVFMFPGQGTQYAGMAASLYHEEALFRAIVDECAALLAPLLECDLRSVLFPDAAGMAAADAALNRTELTQPALFVVEYALARQLMAWGIAPSMMVGHSVGEYVAATLAGVFTLADALTVVAARGRVTGAQAAGAMLAVPLEAAQTQALLGDQLWLAGVNGPASCTISGSVAAITALAARLEGDGVNAQLLTTSHAFHSGLMDGALAPFRAVLEAVTLHAPTLPYMSNVTGQPVLAEQATSIDYWLAHLRQTVQFGPCMAHLEKTGGHVYVEVGPGHALSNLARRSSAAVRAVSLLPRRGSDACSAASLIQGVGQLWECGAVIDADAFYGPAQRHRLALPTYPFERKRHWIDAGQRAGITPAAAPADTAAVADPVAPAPARASHARPALPTPLVAPRSATEQALCDAWQDLLGIAQVGVNDDFYLLGGHSLLTTQLASRIRTVLKVEIALRALFDTPTVAAQALLVEAARAAHTAPPAPAPGHTIGPADRSAPLALSFAQQRLWFLDQLDAAAGAAFHMPVGLRLQGRLDQPALRAALDRIVARHESLRTVFGRAAGEPFQVIAPQAGFALSERDLSHLAGAEREATLQAIGLDEASMRFDLANGPLIRGQLLRLAEDEHVLLVTQHHIISDGWSIGVLVRELSSLYAAFTQGLADPLAPLPIQYADYAAWQRGWLQGERLQAQVDFWRGHLTGAPALLELPADRPRPAMPSYAGGTVPVALGADLSAGLRALSQRHGVTLFMTLLAGWSVLMARLAGQDEVVTGTPVANRQRSEVEGLIGFFVNTLALRVRVGQDPTVAELLARVKADTLCAYEHQDLPFEQLVEVLQPVRSSAHSPLFQVIFSMMGKQADSQLQLPGLTLSQVEQARHTAQMDLSLSLGEDGALIGGMLEYASDLFDEATARRIAANFACVLAAMVAGEHQPVSTLNLLTGDERRQLAGFNDTATPYPAAHLVHELFEALAAAQPDVVALVSDTVTLTYGQLNGRANTLAARLTALGVGPDRRVAICVERGADMVIALLGVLKAGGAYVPLDPAYPPERLAYMLADSAPLALLTQGALAAHCAQMAPQLPLLVLDAPDLLAETAANPRVPGLSPDHLAYVIYTSGSTGQPKGVMNRHGGLCNLATAQQALFGNGPGSRVLQFASFSFDASVWEMVMAICSGAALHLAAHEQLRPGEPLLQTLRARAITHVTLPSSALALWDDPAALQPMTLIVAGDACAPALAASWSTRHRFFNAYGPTETTVCATVYRCAPGHTGILPIGTPIANTQVHLLDRHRQLAPLGAVGEICIGGAAVARGYLNREALTAERFVADPFTPGARLYCTGDLGRWLPDGNLEFLGRNDYQVKLRGFRIELGEIEAALTACAGVRDALVVAREDQPGDQRLVAYLIADAGAAPAAGELRARLAQTLADYMLPAAFVILDAWPLGGNGKLDRQALPAPGLAAVASRTYAAPEGELEAAIAHSWQELLGIERVGRDDHFFELGGYSLLATRFVAGMRDLFDIDIPLISIFKWPTVATLAHAVLTAELERYSQADIDSALADIARVPDALPQQENSLHTAHI